MSFGRRPAREFRRRYVYLGQFVIQPLRRQLETRRAVCVGLEDLGAGLDVLSVDGEHDLGAGKIQLVITAVDVNALGIDHRPHRSVEDSDTIFPDELAKLIHKISGSNAKDLAPENNARSFTISFYL